MNEILLVGIIIFKLGEVPNSANAIGMIIVI